jgi:hypothetical protein
MSAINGSKRTNSGGKKLGGKSMILTKEGLSIATIWITEKKISESYSCSKRAADPGQCSPAVGELQD